MANTYCCSGYHPTKGWYNEFYNDKTDKTIRVYDSGEVEVVDGR